MASTACPIELQTTASANLANALVALSGKVDSENASKSADAARQTDKCNALIGLKLEESIP